MTTIENILVGLWFGMGRNRTPKRQDDEARELLRLVGLDSKADAIASELTLSELRRLEVARALATNPRLLLLDEMAAGLSPEAISRSVELVKALRNRGLTLLIIDHFLNLTARVSDRLIALDKGEIIAEGKPSEVLECPAVMSSYLGNRQQRDE